MAVFLLIIIFLSAYILFFAILGLCISKPAATKELSASEEVKFLVLVPAHNEGEYLRPTLRSLHALRYAYEKFHVVVIADNCTDDTALVAAQEGCEVWKRDDVHLRGKGHALAWAFNKMQVLSFDAVVIVDADTIASTNLLDIFNREIHLGHSVMQAQYNCEFPPETAPWFRLISHISKRSEECFISRPRSKFGLYQGLQGNGFCLLTPVLEKAPWRAGSICEDQEYSLSLTNYGMFVHYVEDASITAAMTGHLQHASGQRKRWAGGTFSLITKHVPRLAVRAFRKRDWRILEACIYLVTVSRIPLFILAALATVFLLLDRHNVHTFCWMLLGMILLLQSFYAMAMMSTTRKECSYGRMIVGLPVYIAWLSWQQCVALVTMRNPVWNRTERG